MWLVPKNWAEFQHYKDRSPPWIKLHKKLLTDRAYACLPLASKALAPMLWLLASESKDGSFDASPEELTFRIHVTEKDVANGLPSLIKAGFFIPVQSDSTLLAERSHVAPDSCSEREGETEREAEGERVRATTPFLEGVSSELLADYLKIRKAKRAGELTSTAIKALTREASKAGLTIEQAVTACVEFSWQGFNAGWYAERTQGKTKPGAVVATGSHDPDSRSAIEAEGIAKGIGPWNEIAEQWHIYKTRVRGQQMNNLGLDALAAMAAQRSQAGAH